MRPVVRILQPACLGLTLFVAPPLEARPPGIAISDLSSHQIFETPIPANEVLASHAIGYLPHLYLPLGAEGMDRFVIECIANTSKEGRPVPGVKVETRFNYVDAANRLTTLAKKITKTNRGGIALANYLAIPAPGANHELSSAAFWGFEAKPTGGKLIDLFDVRCHLAEVTKGASSFSFVNARGADVDRFRLLFDEDVCVWDGDATLDCGEDQWKVTFKDERKRNGPVYTTWDMTGKKELFYLENVSFLDTVTGDRFPHPIRDRELAERGFESGLRYSWYPGG